MKNKLSIIEEYLKKQLEKAKKSAKCSKFIKTYNYDLHPKDYYNGVCKGIKIALEKVQQEINNGK